MWAGPQSVKVRKRFNYEMPVFRMDELYTSDRRVTVLLAGTITSEHVFEIRSRLEQLQRTSYSVILDLKQLRHTDREGVSLFVWAKQMGTSLLNAPSWVGTWIALEGDRQQQERG
jgi:ABC-type transporter Mla MlaB component